MLFRASKGPLLQLCTQVRNACSILVFISVWAVFSNSGNGQSCGQFSYLNNTGGESISTAVSANGEVVVGRLGGTVPFRWTSENGLEVLPFAGYANSISGNGNVVVGSDQNGAFRWSEETGLERLSPNAAWAYGTSEDGNVVVGTAGYDSFSLRAFRWVFGVGLQDLGLLPGWEISEANAVSADGEVVVGRLAFRMHPPERAFRWSATEGMLELGTLGGAESNAVSVSRDGNVIVGYSTSASGMRAFRWTSSSGMTDLGTLTEGGWSAAKGVSADGHVVVGYSVDSSGRERPFRWTLVQGMEAIDPESDTGNAFATAVSEDGSSVVGAKFSLEGIPRAFLWGGDTDGDGLRDDWECNGVPYTTSNGASRRYILDEDGDGVSDANPLRKDIFVEVDSMTGFAPTQSDLQPVIEAFDNAPVENPNGSPQGIKLHVLIDGSDLNIPPADFTCHGQVPNEDCFTEFRSIKNSSPSYGFGTDAERAQSDWQFAKLAKAKAFRYCIFAKRIAGREGWSGLAEDYWCDDFMILLGNTRSDGTMMFPNGGDGATKASVFMHELGHSLGLHHGGGDGNSALVQISPSTTINQNDIHFKPNYYSVMNYLWTFPHAGAGPLLRYSDGSEPALNENALREDVGLGTSFTGQVAFWRHVGATQCVDTNCDLFIPGVTNPICYNKQQRPTDNLNRLDWNGDCDIDENVTVSADINDFRELAPNGSEANLAYWGDGLTPLVSHNDWDNLKYDFRGAPRAQPNAPAVYIGCTIDENLVNLSARLGTLPCDSIDFNNDTSLFDPQDIEAFLSVYSEGPCVPASATCNDIDFNNDTSLFDPCDINSFLLMYSEGPCTPCGQ